MTPADPTPFSRSEARLGWFPVIFFCMHQQVLTDEGMGAAGLWVCNSSNLLLGLGFLAGIPAMIRVAFLWLFAGIPFWLFDMHLTGERYATAFFTHFGGMGLGLYGISRVRMSRQAWWQAVIFFFGLQIISRYATPPDLNVNVAHRVRDEVKPWLTQWHLYWMLTSGLAMLTLKALGEFFLARFPPVGDTGPQTP